jgi:CheY-like chemotaxis protein
MLQWISASERRFTRLGALNDARVLVAHPYHASRRALRALLEPLGCAVTEAGSAAEVLELARRRRPHVLLLDAALEREASASVVGAIKSDPDLFAIAIVLVGAYGDAADALEALERGAHDVLPDDADAFELAARVRAARRGSETHRSCCSPASARSSAWPTTTSSPACRTAARCCASSRRSSTVGAATATRSRS